MVQLKEVNYLGNYFKDKHSIKKGEFIRCKMVFMVAWSQRQILITCFDVDFYD